MVMRKFTQTFDINTEVGAPTLLGIHTPIGGDMWNFLAPFFFAYKKYKYHGCDITIVNSAKLPVDPEQVGKVSGDNYVDPRDTLNPMMFKGCHGESLGHVINSMYGGLTSDIFKVTALDKEQFNAILEDFYYTALGDDAWRKAPVQKTLRIRGLHPLVYNLATTHQIAMTDNLAPSAYPENNYAEANGRGGTVPTSQFSNDNSKGVNIKVADTNVYDPNGNVVKAKAVGNVLTNKCMRLGWMDTLQFLGNRNVEATASPENIALLPKLFMGILMLPPAYLCRQYLRVVITHRISFKGYRTITTGGNIFTNVRNAGYAFGYGNLMTGNTPSSKASVGGSEKADALGSETDAEEIEEADDDEWTA